MSAKTYRSDRGPYLAAKEQLNFISAEAAETKRRAECYPGLVEALKEIIRADSYGELTMDEINAGSAALRAAGEIE